VTAALLVRRAGELAATGGRRAPTGCSQPPERPRDATETCLSGRRAALDASGIGAPVAPLSSAAAFRAPACDAIGSFYIVAAMLSEGEV